MFSIDWKGLALPFAYLIVLSGALMTFSTIYRKRKAAESANLAPWFGPNLQRNVYMSLLHTEPEVEVPPPAVMPPPLEADAPPPYPAPPPRRTAEEEAAMNRVTGPPMVRMRERDHFPHHHYLFMPPLEHDYLVTSFSASLDMPRHLHARF
ncbi:hypothetical protein NLG97_g8822 [Lecanicillium saksenae]|uniref:Uncharacterized protein n=1 Tax=Lecanicillium saksenae TaxID=468837 RepID=A0ACC1QJL7_9HYPO|nr:hypothetical protein NLG97_g8822 [Lecanicillium saksenae]